MIDHIALIVSNVKKIKEILENIGKFNWHNEIVMEQEVEVLFIDGNPRIEFISPLKANSPISKYLLKKGEYAFHHIAIKTKNIEKEINRLKNKGYKFTTNKPMNGANNTKIAFIHPKSTGGILIELISYE